MKYRIVIEKPAEKFIVKLQKTEKERVLRALYESTKSYKYIF